MSPSERILDELRKRLLEELPNMETLIDKAFMPKEPKYSTQFVEELRKAVFNASKPSRFQVPLTPRLLANMRSVIVENGIPTTHIVAGSQFFKRVIGDRQFQSLFDPVATHKDLVIGYVGSIIGLDVIDDSFARPSTRFLDPHYMAVVALNVNDQDTWSTDTPLVQILDVVSTLVS